MKAVHQEWLHNISTPDTIDELSAIKSISFKQPTVSDKSIFKYTRKLGRYAPNFLGT